MRFSCALPGKQYRDLIAHLLPRPCKTEEAAFLFCRTVASEEHTVFELLEMHLVPASEFTYKSLYGMELTDGCRADVVKRAHDLGASIIEVHSHPKSRTVEFSGSDRIGFEDFVPHVWWRLKKKPYAAVVVGPNNFDSLSWNSDPRCPAGALDLQVGQQVLHPTGLSLKHWEHAYEL